MSAPGRLRRNAAGYLLAGPFVAAFALFVAVPLVQSVWLSTRQTFGAAASEPVGAANFARLAADPRFWRAVANTTAFTAGSVALQIPTALALALLLNRPGLRGRGLYRLAFFAPQVVGLTFGAVLASLAFDKRTGLVNQALHALTEAFDACLPGRQPPWNLDFPWLQEHALAALVLASVWLYAGFHMLFFLAALQNVSPELREAAVLDGAGAVLRFRHVTLPAIRPVAGFLVLLAVIGGLQLFELPYIMLQSAWAGDHGLTVVMYLYEQGFQIGDLGYASAVGWVLGLVLIAAALLQRALARGAEA